MLSFLYSPALTSIVLTNLDSILKSRDITLPTKFHLVKAMVFPAQLRGSRVHVKQQLEEKEQGGDGPSADCAAQMGPGSPLGARAAGGESGGRGCHGPAVDKSSPG